MGLLISGGANPNSVVEKLKKYRENPDLAKTEETAENKNFITDADGNKIYKEYSQAGLQSALHLISSTKNLKLLSFILSLHPHINQKDFEGNTPLLKFLKTAKIQESIDLLLQHKADPNIVNHQQQSAVHVIVLSENIEYLFILIKFSINLDLKDANGNTGLHIAASKRSDKILRVLCENGANTNLVDKKQRTPLHIAFNSATTSSNASFNIESLLLLYGGNINQVDYKKRSPLHYAFVKIHQKNDVSQIDPIETVSSACSKKEIDVNIQDKYLRTPLHYAARRGALTSTMFLLSKGALIDLEDSDGNTPLGLGIIGLHSNYVSMLIQRNPNISKKLYHKEPVDTKNEKKAKNRRKSEKKNKNKLKYKEYSYFRACVRLDWQGAAYLLLFAGYPYSLAMQDALNEEKFDLVLTLFAKVDDPAVFSTLNSDGQNLFHTLAIKGSKASEDLTQSICQQLIDFKVNIHTADKLGRTPLHYAAEKQYYKLCIVLIERGANINAKDNDGNTPIVKAVEKDLIKTSLLVLQLFKRNNADFSVGILNEGVKTSIFLHAITSQCNDTILKYLIESGCNVTETDSIGRNALMLMIVNNDFSNLKKFVKKYKFDLNHQDSFGQTVVHYVISPFPSISYENKEMLAFLLSSGADGKIKNNEDKSPYFYASLQLSGTMLKVLESFKIKESVTATRKFSGFEESQKEIDFVQDAEDYEKALNDIKHVEQQKFVPDPAGDFADYYEVVEDYDVHMNKVDVSYGPFSAYVFYRMQILHDKNRDVYVVFTR